MYKKLLAGFTAVTLSLTMMVAPGVTAFATDGDQGGALGATEIK